MYANTSTSSKSDSTLLKAILFNFSPLIPIINLQRNQYPDNHQQFLPNGIQQVFAGLIVSPDSYREEALADLAEEAEHQLVVASSNYKKGKYGL